MDTFIAILQLIAFIAPFAIGYSLNNEFEKKYNRPSLVDLGYPDPQFFLDRSSDPRRLFITRPPELLRLYFISGCHPQSCEQHVDYLQ